MHVSPLPRDDRTNGWTALLPPEPFTTWGARARIAWLEHRSRKER